MERLGQENKEDGKFQNCFHQKRKINIANRNYSHRNVAVFYTAQRSALSNAKDREVYNRET